MQKCPNWPKVTFKTALRKAAEAKAIVQVKGTFTLQTKTVATLSEVSA